MCRHGQMIWKSLSAKLQDPLLGVACKVRRKGKPIQSVSVQLQELTEGIAGFNQPPKGLHSRCFVGVNSPSLKLFRVVNTAVELFDP
jgi:hypothetical protein